MKNNYCKRLQMLLACLLMSCVLLSCSESETDGGVRHDPSKPITLDSFWPQKGPIATQVIIEGSNFGTNVEDITVLFNEKPATIISSKGDRMLVLAPKLPGEECVITVKVGNKSAQFKEIFDYIVQTSVSTVVGGIQGAAMPNGTMALAGAQFSKKVDRNLVIDSNDNLFISFGTPINGDADGIYMLNAEAASIKLCTTIGIFLNNVIIGYNLKDDCCVWYNSNIGNDDYGMLDPMYDYENIPVGRTSWEKKLNYTDGMVMWGARSSITMNPADGKFYFYTNEGTVARFDPSNGKGDDLTNDNSKALAGDVMGVVFDPRDNNIAYVAVKGQHCIYMHNISEGTFEIWAGRKNSAGHLDGARTEAQFNEPCQMCCDGEYIYVADRSNHCIRKINLTTGYVVTHAGVARTPGYVNGEADESKFNYPVGCVVDSEGNLYVGDSENYAIRRVATE